MNEFRSRTLDQEPDAIAIIPKHPEFMVIGTYTKLPEPEGDGDGNPVEINGGRSGSLEILPSSSSFNVLSSIPETSVSCKKFPFGIYDIKFHPQHEGLLGVATSDAEILFFNVSSLTPMSGTDNLLRFSGLGKVVVEEPHSDDGRRAIITKVHFINVPKGSLKSPDSKERTVLLLATTQFGNTKLVQVTLQPDAKHDDYTRTLESQTVNIHKQDWNIEAWTVLHMFTSPSTLYILSGGDDNQLLISSIELPIHEYADIADLDFDLPAPVKKLSDVRSHEAGVVDICNMGLYPPGSESSLQSLDDQSLHAMQYLVLSGSYDERLRLFLFSPASPQKPATKLTLLSEIHLGGGVWRIILLDKYNARARQGRDYILLVAAHSAGACIVRLSCTPVGVGHWTFAFKVEKWFTEGHESFVYAVAAKQAVTPGQTWDNKTWDIVSSSFYDKKVCDWTWVDEAK